MNHKIFLFTVILCLSFNSLVKAQGAAAVPFLTIEPSAKANGMAGSFTAIANDASAMFYNPAGLTNMKIASVDFVNYTNWNRQYYQTGPEYWFAAGTVTIPEAGSFGISYTRYNLGKMIWTDETGAELGTFDSYEWALAVAYARTISQTISIGATLKGIFSNLSSVSVGTENRNSSASAGAIDIGLLWQNFLPGAAFSKRLLSKRMTRWSMHRPAPGPSIGISITNIGPAISYADPDQADPLPQMLRLGLSWNFLDTDIIGSLISIDARKLLVKRYRDGSSDAFYEALFTSWEDSGVEDIALSIGQEISIMTFFSLRVGRFIESSKYGARNYWTYGFSAGPETARFNFSVIDVDDNSFLNETKFICVFSVAY